MTGLEAQLRATLRDPAHDLPAPADPVGWVRRRARRQALLHRVATVAVTVAIAAVTIPLATGHSPRPSPAGGLLAWPARGDARADSKLLEIGARAWREQAARIRGVPVPSGPARVLFAGHPPGDSARILVLQAVAADGRPWVADVVEVATQPSVTWQLEQAAPLGDPKPSVLVLHAGNSNPLSLNPLPATSRFLLTGPGVTSVEVRTPTARRQPASDGFQRVALSGGIGRVDWFPENDAGLALRAYVGSREVFAGTEGCPPDWFSPMFRGPVPQPIAVRLVAAAWPPLGAGVPASQLRIDALLAAQASCTASVRVAVLWSGVLPGGAPAHVVQLATTASRLSARSLPRGTPPRVVQLITTPWHVAVVVGAGGRLQAERPRPADLHGVDLVATAVTANGRTAPADTLLVVARPGVARLVYRQGGVVVADVRDRLLVSAIRRDLPGPSRVTAYDAAGVVVADLAGAALLE